MRRTDENASWLNLRGVALATAPAEKAKLDRADGARIASKATRQHQLRDDDAAAAQLQEATAVAAARDAGTLVFAAELVERNGAVRQLKLTYHLHAEHGAPAGGVSIEELPTNCANTGRVVGSARSLAARHNESAPVPFLARTRVLRDGTTHPANHDLQEQPTFHQVTPCTDRSKGEPHVKLRERLHWPAPAEEQFLQPEDLVPGAHHAGHRLRLSPRAARRVARRSRALLPGGHRRDHPGRRPRGRRAAAARAARRPAHRGAGGGGGAARRRRRVSREPDDGRFGAVAPREVVGMAGAPRSAADVGARRAAARERDAQV